MKENLPVKENKSIFHKIRKFFRKLFYKDETGKDTKEIVEKTDTKKKSQNKSIDFQDKIKIEVKNGYVKEIKREELLDEIDKNFNVLYGMSIDKLKRIEKCYKESIKQHKEKLTEIKQQN